MYHPYLRGKQFELMTVRETADLLAAESFVPIVEPVRQALNGLERALAAVEEAGGNIFVVVNPQHGDFCNNNDDLELYIKERSRQQDNVRPAFILDASTSKESAEAFLRRFDGRDAAFIHSGFRDARSLGTSLSNFDNNIAHIFQSKTSDALYRRHFKGNYRVVLEDGFERQKNSAYAPVDNFSSLHITFNETYNGFGDYLTVGDEYSEGGGPAYAVAIHLTYIDPNDDDRMYVYHFKSDDNDTPVDPGKKFRQALAKVVGLVNSSNSHLYPTESLNELVALHEAGHFPGLGYVKKLSMKHHIETMALFLAEKQ